jgi:Flp pilus assembly protein TadB
MVVLLLLLGAGAGLGAWALAIWLIPPRPPLAELVGRLTAPRSAPSLLETDGRGWAARMGRPLTGPLRELGIPGARMSADLAVTERSADAFLSEKALLAVVGLLLPGAVEVLVLVAGHPLPWPVPAGLSLAAAVGGFLLPDMTVRQEAQQRRLAFRHALSAYLDLVHVLLAGGAGVEGALTDAAAVGEGWSFRQLRRALTTARITRTSPWTALGQLGRELHITELVELAGALSLAGTEGARIRASLAAKSAAARHRDATDAEARANAATERMAMPAMVMAIGFIAFVFYPALTQITASL